MAFKVYFTASDIELKYYGVLYSESRKVLDVGSGVFVDPLPNVKNYHKYFDYQSIKNFLLQYPETIIFNEGKYHLSVMSHEVDSVVDYEKNDLETVIEGIWNPVLKDFIDIRYANTYYTGNLSTFNTARDTVVASNFSDEFAKKAYETISKAVGALNFFINLQSADQSLFGFCNIGILESRRSAELYIGWTNANFDSVYSLEFKDGTYNQNIFSITTKFDSNGFVIINNESFSRLLTGDFSITVKNLNGVEIVKGSTRQLAQTNVSIFPKPDLTGGVKVSLQRGTLPQRISVRGVQ